MADYSVTAASVVPASGSTIVYGTAGEALSAGEAVRLDAATQLIRSCKALSVANGESNPERHKAVVGISVSNAAAGQPIAYVSAGPVTFNSTFTQGVTVYLSQSNGSGLMPVGDLTSGNYNIIMGVALSATSLFVDIINTGVTL